MRGGAIVFVAAVGRDIYMSRGGSLVEAKKRGNAP